MLWEELKGRKFRGLKFRRQYPIRFLRSPERKDFHIADFCCCSLSLIIELDGRIHDNLKLEDKVRDDNLNELGFRILRIQDEMVRRTPELALQVIAEFIDRVH